MEYALVAGMAAAFVVAVLREFPTPDWLDGIASAALCALSVRILSGQWLPVQALAACFVAAFLGMAVRRLSERAATATRRDLRRQVPPL